MQEQLTASQYEEIKKRFAVERDRRMDLRPGGKKQYTAPSADISENFDPNTPTRIARDAIAETVDVAIIGGGFSALVAASRILQQGPCRIRIIDRGADFGGTWYWNRYPGCACDSLAFDYMPLLDEMDYVPRQHYAGAPEIFDYARSIGQRHKLYERTLFQTTVIETLWQEESQCWRLKTDRGDTIRAQFVICANGSMAKPKLALIEGMERFQGHSFHTSRWDFTYTGQNLENLSDKVVGLIGTGATAIQAVPKLGATAKQLYVFQRTPSSVQPRLNQPTDPNWARKLGKNWQAERRMQSLINPRTFTEIIYGALADGGSSRKKEALKDMSAEERAIEFEQANIDYTLLVHKFIENVVKDRDTAEALKPWYMFGCKRPTFHDDYLPTFNRPNVRLIDTKGKGVSHITEKGPVVDGVPYELDLLIYATGFEVQKVGTYNRIVGKAGLSLDNKYSDGLSTYLGIHSAGFPNLFFIGGRQAAFRLNIMEVLQPQAEYVANFIHDMLGSGIVSIEPKRDVEDAWVRKIAEGARNNMKFLTECTPGYFNNEGDTRYPQNGSFSGSLKEYIDLLNASREYRERYFDLAPA